MFLSEAICKKLVFRGGITIGRLYINNYQIWGKGLCRAHELEEKKAIFPRVIFDDDLEVRYPCVTGFKMPETIAKKDFDDFYYVDYLSGLSHEKDIEKVQSVITQIIQEQKEKNNNNTKVLMKYEWLKQYSKCLSNKSK